MKPFPLVLAVIATFCLLTLSSQAAGSSPLKDFLVSRGYTAVKMERQYNTPFIRVRVNEKAAIFVIATNSVKSGIDRASRARFGFSERQTGGRVKGTFGLTNERYGLTQLNRVVIGGSSFTNFPAAVLNLADLARGPNIGHADGLIGQAEMRRYGAVIDFSQEMFYINPIGADASVTEKLKSLLKDRGFIRIPMRFSSDQFQVACQINGHPTKIAVDTGAFFTVLKIQTANQTGVRFVPGSIIGGAAGGIHRRLNTATIRDFVVGECRTANQNIAVANALFDCLGVNYLTVNAAIIDIDGANLYLRCSH